MAGGAKVDGARPRTASSSFVGSTSVNGRWLEGGEGGWSGYGPQGRGALHDWQQAFL